MKNKFGSLGFGAGLLAVSSILSRILGLLRDMTIAYIFGTGEREGLYALDAYFAAFRIPDLIYTFLVAGAMSAAFVPIYTQLRKGSQKKASIFGSQAIHLMLILLLIVCGLMWVFAPLFIPLLTPGFTEGMQEKTVFLSRIMLLSPLFLGLSSVLQGIENSHKSFWGIAIAPLVYNLSLILGAYFFGVNYGVIALSWSVVIGAFLHFLVQLPGVLITPFNYEWNWKLKNQAVKDFIRLTMPRMFGIAFTQMNVLLDTLLASLLSFGSLSIYNYSLNLQSLAHVVVSVSVSVAVFASLSEFDDLQDFKSSLKRAFHTILFWVIPSIFGLFLLRNEVIEILLVRGAFDKDAGAKTAFMLGVFVWAAFGQSMLPLFARAFYALKDTKTPVFIAFFASLLQIILSLLFVLIFKWPVWSLALSAIFGTLLNAILLIFTISRRIKESVYFFFDKNLFWIFLHAFFMSILVLMLKKFNYSNPILELTLIIPLAGVLDLYLHKLTGSKPAAL